MVAPSPLARARSPRRVAGLLAIAVGTGACDDAGDRDARDAAIDAGRDPDAAPADPCGDPLVTGADGLRLSRCDEGATFALRAGDSTILAAAAPSVTLVGRTLAPLDWPDASWRTLDERSVQARFSGLAGVPDLLLWLTVTDGLYVDVWLEAPASATPLVVDEVRVLSATLGADSGTPPATWRALPGAPGPPVAAVGAARATEQVVVGPSRGVLVAASDPERGDVRVALAAGREATSLSLVVTSAEPATSLEPGGVLRAPTTVVRVGSDPLRLLEAHAAAVATATGADRPASWGWGWRSAPAYGALVNEFVLRAESAAWSAHARTHGVAPPAWILADGLWYRALGDFAPGDGFPSGFRGLAESFGGARLALRWPAAFVADEAPVRAEHPEWLLRGPGGGEVPCAAGARACSVLDPGPARGHLRSTAVALRAGGASWLLDEGTGATAPAGTPARRAAAAAIRDVLGRDGFGATADLALVGLASVESTAADERSALGARCAEEAISAPGPRSDACRSALVDLTPADAAPAPSAEALRARAFALAATWHHGVFAALDGGPVLVSPPRTPGEARQSAALAALAGGPYLIGDPAAGLDAERLGIAFAPLRVPLSAGAARPLDLFSDADDPPSVWRAGDRALAFFNWTDAPRRFEDPGQHAPGVTRATSLFPGTPTDDLQALESLEVAPRDVVVLVGAME